MDQRELQETLVRRVTAELLDFKAVKETSVTLALTELVARLDRLDQLVCLEAVGTADRPEVPEREDLKEIPETQVRYICSPEFTNSLACWCLKLMSLRSIYELSS